MKDLEEAAEEQNPQGLLAPKSEEDDEDLAGPSSTFGYTYTIPTKGRQILPVNPVSSLRLYAFT